MLRGPFGNGNAGIGWSVPCAAAEQTIASGTKSAHRIALRRCLELAFVIKSRSLLLPGYCLLRHTAVGNRGEQDNRHVNRLRTSESAAQREFKPFARSRVQSGHP